MCASCLFVVSWTRPAVWDSLKATFRSLIHPLATGLGQINKPNRFSSRPVAKKRKKKQISGKRPRGRKSAPARRSKASVRRGITFPMRSTTKSERRPAERRVTLMRRRRSPQSNVSSSTDDDSSALPLLSFFLASKHRHTLPPQQTSDGRRPNYSATESSAYCSTLLQSVARWRRRRHSGDGSDH